MSIYADLHLDGKPPMGAVTVPSSSLLNFAGSQRIIYIVREGKAYWTLVQTGESNGEKTEIVSGVGISDQIVLDPSALEGRVVPVEIKTEP
jgi:hypothetical protein